MPRNNIDSAKLLVKDVFTKWYRIPEYQRPYVWEKDQVIELLDDVIQARLRSQESQYFLGSMVLQKRQNKENGTTYEEYDVLDGQQRLTTLFLITAVIRDLTSEKTRLETCERTIYQMANPDDNIPERLRIEFDIREDVKQFVDKFIKELGGTLKVTAFRACIDDQHVDLSVKRMAEAVLTVHEYFQDKEKIDLFFPYLRSNVLMIYVSADELDDAFRLFTVMNNRGVKLRNSDILKAENLRAVTDKSKQAQCAKIWEEAESYFGEDFDAFLSHLRTILVRQKSSVSLLREFEDNIYNPKIFDRNTKTYQAGKPILSKGENTFKFVQINKQNYEYLFENEHYDLTNSFELYNTLQLMKKGFEADFWIAPLLMYYEKFQTKKLIDFVKLIDNKFANDWLTGLTPTKRIENINSILNVIDVAPDSDFVIKDASLSIDKNELGIVINGNIYGKRAARYVMLKLDLLFHGHTSKFSIHDTISIEHILPQNPSPRSQWLTDFTNIEREEWTNRLGNLVLISRRKNSAQSNKDYSEKRERYFKKNIETFSNSVRLLNKYQVWNPASLKNNHAIVTETLKKGFGIL